MRSKKVKLVAITQSLIDDINSAEDIIAYAARVSNPNNQLNTETAPRLLNFCIRHKHWSIFEQADLSVEIKTSRAIAAQILRHKSFSFQEFSQRYSPVQDLEELQWRKQGATNRQVGDESVELSENMSRAIDMLQRDALEIYDELIDSGIAKECARMILPLNTQTTMYMKGNIRSWLGYINVRAEQHTQKEHRDIAVAVAHLLKRHYPIVAEATNDFNDFKGGFM